jgi:ribonuclease VapC
LIVDSSAVMAIMLGESDAPQYAQALSAVSPLRMSTATFLETAIVAEGRGGANARRLLDRLLEGIRIELVPVTVEQAHVAREAWQQFGRGNHPAALNFGDCFAYALARTAGEPLLYKGEDFALTDIESA